MSEVFTIIYFDRYFKITCHRLNSFSFFGKCSWILEDEIEKSKTDSSTTKKITLKRQYRIFATDLSFALFQSH